MVFPDIYNHRDNDLASDGSEGSNHSRSRKSSRKFSTVDEVSEGNSVTPTDSIRRKRSSKNTDLLDDRLEQLEGLSSLKHLENTAMGKKRPVRISQF